MSEKDVEQKTLELVRASGARLEGHFLFTSGLHSPFYFQCALLLRYPRNAAYTGEQIAKRLEQYNPDIVVSPAMGGVIIGHEMGRALGKPALFVERPTGTFELRRGFTIDPGAKVLMVEDVVTTGLSSREAMACIAAAGGEVIAEAALVDRSAGNVDLGIPFYPLVAINFPTYAEDELPPELAKTKAVKPGSRAN